MGRGGAQVLPGPSETGLDLVDDEEDVVLVADGAEALEVALRGSDVAAFSEDGFDDDARRVGRSTLLLQQEFELWSRIRFASRINSVGRTNFVE